MEVESRDTNQPQENLVSVLVLARHQYVPADCLGILLLPFHSAGIVRRNFVAKVGVGQVVGTMLIVVTLWLLVSYLEAGYSLVSINILWQCSPGKIFLI